MLESLVPLQVLSFCEIPSVLYFWLWFQIQFQQFFYLTNGCLRLIYVCAIDSIMVWLFCNKILVVRFYCSEIIHEAIYDFWQWITLHGNIWSLATNNIVWQKVLLPRYDRRGNNAFGNKIMVWQYRLLQRRCSWQMSLLLRYRSLHVPLLATETNVASAYIATIVNVAITSYCHAWQHTAMVARNSNSCNAKLATVAIPYCNMTFCNHWQWTRFGCNIYLLQPNWAYCNVFCHCTRVRS